MLVSCGLQAQTFDWKWLNPTPEGAEPMYDIHMPDSQTMVAAGRDGHVMRSADGGQTWSVQKAAESTLFALDFGDAQHGWACGKQGLLVKTSNGGISWTVQSVPGSFDFNDVDFVDAQNGWLAGPGVILRTSNGGNTWQNVSPNTFFSAGGIHFITAQEGWFCGTIGAIMHTTDGGTTWTSQTSNSNNELRDIRFLDNQTGWACGVSGTIVKTGDGGNTWTVQPSGANLTYLNAVAIADAQTAWVCGQDGSLLKTSNGGSNWSSVYPSQISMDFWGIASAGNKLVFSQAPPVNFPGIGKLAISEDAGLTWQVITKSLTMPRCEFRDVIVRTPQEWWAMGNSIDSGYVLKTTDGGINWLKKTFNRGINTGALHNANLGWIAGADNQIYKTTDGGITWTSQAPANVSADYYDIQILNDQTLWVAGYDDDDEGVVIKSTDGGQSWINVNGIINEALSAIHFTDDQKGWAVGNSNVILKTSDGGQTWNADTLDSGPGYLKSVFFTSSSTGYVAGASGHFYKTTDGGLNWNPSGPGGFKGLVYNEVQFIHPDTGFIVRNDGRIFTTTDAAATWTESTITPSREIFSIQMLNSRQGIIGGDQASLLSTNGGNVTNVPVLQTNDISLFPNPVKDVLELRLHGEIQEIRLTDLSGRLIMASSPSDKKIELARLQPGIYLLSIRTQQAVSVHKIVKE